MTHVLLVNPPYSATAMNIGLLYIGSFLKENGIDVEIFDYALHEQPTTQLKRSLKGVDYVGVSCMTAQVKGALNVAKIVREYDPSLPIIWGGVHPTLYPVQTCSSESVNYVIFGEGEQSLLELVNALEKGKTPNGIRGVAYKVRNEVKLNHSRPFLKLDELPQPHYDLVDMERYKELYLSNSAGYFPVHSGRGCPHRCAFCINVTLRKRFWVGKSSEKVLDDIDILYHKYNIKRIIFNDDNWATSKKRVYKICEGLKERNLDVRFSADIRVNYLNDEFLGITSKHGLIRAGIGAESGSDRVLRMIKKDISVQQTIQSAKLCQKWQVTPFYSFMVGLPGETWDDTMKTWALIKLLKKLCPIATFTELQLYRPYPGTELFNKAKLLGFHEPKSLEEWATSFDEFISPHELPWIDDPDKIQITRLTSWFGRTPVVSRLIMIKSARAPSDLIRVLFLLDFTLRWKYKIFRITPELKLFMKGHPHIFEYI